MWLSSSNTKSNSAEVRLSALKITSDLIKREKINHPFTAFAGFAVEENRRLRGKAEEGRRKVKGQICRCNLLIGGKWSIDKLPMRSPGNGDDPNGLNEQKTKDQNHNSEGRVSGTPLESRRRSNKHWPIPRSKSREKGCRKSGNQWAQRTRRRESIKEPVSWRKKGSKIKIERGKKGTDCAEWIGAGNGFHDLEGRTMNSLLNALQ